MRFEGSEEVFPLLFENCTVSSRLLCFAAKEGAEEGTAIAGHALSPSVDNPINLPCGLPVSGVIKAELNTKHA